MKKPKLPKNVVFLGKNFERISEKEGWGNLLHIEELTLEVGGVPRRYRLSRDSKDLVRVMIPDGDYRTFDNEGEVEEFALWTLVWAQARRNEALMSEIRSSRRRFWPHEVRAPKKNKKTNGQFRLF